MPNEVPYDFRAEWKAMSHSEKQRNRRNRLLEIHREMDDLLSKQADLKAEIINLQEEKRVIELALVERPEFEGEK